MCGLLALVAKLVTILGGVGGVVLSGDPPIKGEQNIQLHRPQDVFQNQIAVTGVAQHLSIVWRVGLSSEQASGGCRAAHPLSTFFSFTVSNSLAVIYAPRPPFSGVHNLSAHGRLWWLNGVSDDRGDNATIKYPGKTYPRMEKMPKDDAKIQSVTCNHAALPKVEDPPLRRTR